MLIPTEEGVWKLMAFDPDKWILEYLCCNIDTDTKEILSVDPPDGPYMAVGSKFDGITIDKITNDDGKILIYAKDEKEV